MNCLLEAEIIALADKHLMTAYRWAIGKKTKQIEVAAKEAGVSYDEFRQGKLEDCLNIIDAFHELTIFSDAISDEAIEKLDNIRDEAGAIQFSLSA